ncbi:MAG: hypothetical protein EGQ00_09650 [Parabacteroides johnsonii]|nr:hypothetical protein [Parabacteroides johnsonii]
MVVEMDVNDVENSRKKEGFELKKRWKKPLFCVVEQTFGQQEGAWMEISAEVNDFVIIVLRVMGVDVVDVKMHFCNFICNGHWY